MIDIARLEEIYSGLSNNSELEQKKQDLKDVKNIYEDFRKRYDAFVSGLDIEGLERVGLSRSLIDDDIPVISALANRRDELQTALSDFMAMVNKEKRFLEQELLDMAVDIFGDEKLSECGTLDSLINVIDTKIVELDNDISNWNGSVMDLDSKIVEFDKCAKDIMSGPNWHDKFSELEDIANQKKIVSSDIEIYKQEINDLNGLIGEFNKYKESLALTDAMRYQDWFISNYKKVSGVNGKSTPDLKDNQYKLEVKKLDVYTRVFDQTINFYKSWVEKITHMSHIPLNQLEMSFKSLGDNERLLIPMMYEFMKSINDLVSSEFGIDANKLGRRDYHRGGKATQQLESFKAKTRAVLDNVTMSFMKVGTNKVLVIFRYKNKNNKFIDLHSADLIDMKCLTSV